MAQKRTLTLGKAGQAIMATRKARTETDFRKPKGQMGVCSLHYCSSILVGEIASRIRIAQRLVALKRHPLQGLVQWDDFSTRYGENPVEKRRRARR